MSLLNDENQIAIRQIQHFLYCPHRWGLIEIDCNWAENYYVTKSNIMHERVHSEDEYTTNNKKTFTAVFVYNDLPEYQIYGELDCLELVKIDDGVFIPNLDGKYIVNIVEHKPTQPKNKIYDYVDLMQVFAQKICVDYIFKCKSNGIIYYANTKKRVKLDLNENYSEYEKNLKELISQIRYYKSTNIIPKVNECQYCNGCSMKDLCMPKIKKTKPVKDLISEMIL